MKGKPFAIIGINGDTDQATITRALATHDITWRSFRDKQPQGPAISQQWNVYGWPTLYLIDQKGIIRAKWHDEMTLDKMNQAVDQLLAVTPLGQKRQGEKSNQ
ncbi:MAG: TlpA family protein disulfide reductase [Pirellulales bacterium]|nr:TlpA family protein disulfide reductase [Pirellulales bacterium]